MDLPLILTQNDMDLAGIDVKIHAFKGMNAANVLTIPRIFTIGCFCFSLSSMADCV